MIYKVSYVVVGRPHPGEIVNQDAPPEVGRRAATLPTFTRPASRYRRLLPVLGTGP
jgi:hypothetical protein